MQLGNNLAIAQDNLSQNDKGSIFTMGGITWALPRTTFCLEVTIKVQ